MNTFPAALTTKLKAVQVGLDDLTLGLGVDEPEPDDLGKKLALDDSWLMMLFNVLSDQFLGNLLGGTLFRKDMLGGEINCLKSRPIVEANYWLFNFKQKIASNKILSILVGLIVQVQEGKVVFWRSEEVLCCCQVHQFVH